ncbi:hypothetical protein ACFQU2_31780 [Siccirubricoccus deserti]
MPLGRRRALFRRDLLRRRGAGRKAAGKVALIGFRIIRNARQVEALGTEAGRGEQKSEEQEQQTHDGGALFNESGRSIAG